MYSGIYRTEQHDFFKCIIWFGYNAAWHSVHDIMLEEWAQHELGIASQAHDDQSCPIDALLHLQLCPQHGSSTTLPSLFVGLK